MMYGPTWANVGDRSVYSLSSWRVLLTSHSFMVVSATRSTIPDLVLITGAELIPNPLHRSLELFCFFPGAVIARTVRAVDYSFSRQRQDRDAVLRRPDPASSSHQTAEEKRRWCAAWQARYSERWPTGAAPKAKSWTPRSSKFQRFAPRLKRMLHYASVSGCSLRDHHSVGCVSTWDGGGRG